MIYTFQHEEVSEVKKTQITELLYQAFKDKLLPIFSLIPKPSHISTLSKLLSFQMGLFYEDNGQILGAMVLGSKGIPYIKVKPDQWKELGFIRTFVMNVVNAPPKEKERLHLGGIAVSPNARGKGIGSKLLHRLYSLARSLGFKKISLEVITSNPRAKKLYEKEGFISLKNVSTSFFTKNMGFNGYDYMEKIF